MSQNLVVSFLLKMVNQTGAPLKAVNGDLHKVANSASAAAKPIGQVAERLDDIDGPARTAADRLDDVGDKAERSASKAGRLAKVLAGDLVHGLKLAAVATIGAVTIGASLVAATGLWVHNQSVAAESTLNAAKSAGIGADSYQRLAYALDRTKLGGGALDSVLKSVNTHLVDAQAGNKAAQAAFQAAGVQIKDASGHYTKADIVLAQVADKFASMPDGPRKSTLALKLFGEAGADLIPLLSKGSKGIRALGDEAQSLGLILSSQTLTAAQKLNAVWDLATAKMKGVETRVFAGLLPAFIMLFSKFAGIIDQNMPAIVKAIGDAIGWLTDNMPAILSGLGKFYAFMASIVRIGGQVVSALGGIGGVFDVLAVLMVGKLALGLASTITSIWGVNAALYGCPIVWIIAGIAAVIVAVYLLIRHWKAVKTFFVGLWGWFKEHFPYLAMFVQPFIDSAGFVIDHWSAVSSFFVGLWNTISSVFNGIGRVWNSLPGPLRSFLAGATAMAVPGGAVFAPGLAQAAGQSPARSVTAGAATAPGLGNGSMTLSIEDNRTRVTQMNSPARVPFTIDNPLFGTQVPP